MRRKFNPLGREHLATGKPHKCRDCGAADIRDGLMHRSQGRGTRLGEERVIEADHAEVSWDTEAESAGGFEHTRCGGVAACEDQKGSVTLPAEVVGGSYSIAVLFDDTAPMWNTLTVTIADKAALRTAVEAASHLAEADYTAATWAPFSLELTTATTVLADEGADQATVDAAHDRLVAAHGALTRIDGKPIPGTEPTLDPAAPVDPGALPVTGAHIAAIIGIATALILVGLGIAYRTRRRTTA